MTQSLKAVKLATVKAGKVEIVLTDSQKIKYAEVVSLFNKSYDMLEQLEGLTLSKGKIENQSAEVYVSAIKSNAMNYQQMQAFRKHIVNSIATSKGQAFNTVEKWLNKIVQAYVKNADLKGWSLPKAESKNAESMSKLRAELSAIDDATLEKQIIELRKASDKDSLKQALKLANEKDKRKTKAENAIKKAESKHTTELKDTLKKFITSLDNDGLLAMMYVKNNFNEIKKQAKKSA